MQFGFMKGKGTTDPFLWQDRCRRILELKVRSSILVLWIWRKLFDRVPREVVSNGSLPGGRLPLLSTRPTVTLATLKTAATSFAAW